MKTMTATQARQRLGKVLSRVLEGEDIGIVHSGSGKIIALRPVEVYSEDYALIEYGLGANEMAAVEKKLLRQARGEKGKVWDGTAESLRHWERLKLGTLREAALGSGVAGDQWPAEGAAGGLRETALARRTEHTATEPSSIWISGIARSQSGFLAPQTERVPVGNVWEPRRGKEVAEAELLGHGFFG
jgi:antitoxin (DNA-binding transcriptional repressor) of toxin-antitoxin stability system